MKTYNVAVTSKADGDLCEIFEYISVALATPDAASRLVSRLYKSMKSLSENPLRCPLAKDSFLSKQGFRTLIVDKYIIFYVVRESDNQVIIHRVLYAKRNYFRLFEGDGQREQK